MDGDGVIYLVVGNKHAEHVVVSLFSLRKHWTGDVAILVGDQAAEELCAPMASLHRTRLIRFDYASLNINKRGSGNTYLAKSSMHRFSPFDRTVFLDADTLVVGDIGSIFPEAGWVNITSWMDWVSTGKMMSGRITGWRDYAPQEVARQLERPWPAINTGVIGFTRESHDTMEAWHTMTKRNVCFICDEIAMQLIFPDYWCNVLDDRFNASPCYPEQWRRHGYAAEAIEDLDRYCIGLNGEAVRVVPDHSLQLMLDISRARTQSGDVRVWHGHGFKFVKKPLGRAVWWPVYRETVSENFCGIADWSPWNENPGRFKRCKFLSYVNNPRQWQ